MMRESYANRQQNPPVLENMEIVVALVLMAGCWFSWYVAHERYNLTNRQIAEVACYLAIGGLAIAGSAILIGTARSRREKAWPHPPMVVSRKQDEQFTADAWKQDAVVLGYDIHGKPWYWPDSRAFLRYRIRIPSRFFVDNRGHQLHRYLIDSGVILSPPH